MLRNLLPPVAGSILSLPEAPPELVLISYPAIVKNIDKALDTLGGIYNINQAYFHSRPLELRHTPANPYTSSLTAERKNEAAVTSGTVHLAIRIRRKKRDPSVVEARCLGMIGTQFRFETLCDFQYLPIRGRVDSNVFDDLLPRLIPHDLPSALCWWDRPDSTPDDTPLFLPPFQFTRYNTPSNKILCRDTAFGVQTRKQVFGHGQNLRLERKKLSLNVNADADFPTAPTEAAVQDANLRCKNVEPHKALEELFKERPLWTRVAVVFKTGLDENILKTLLQKFAFYITNGPFGRLWCRFGYDPRKDPDAVAYQTLVVSFRQHNKIPERQRLKVSGDRAGRLADDTDDEEAIGFSYVPGRLPRVRQMWYSLCDIEISEAQKLIHKSANPEYNKQCGYVSPQVLEQIRSMIKDDVRKTSTDLDVVDMAGYGNEAAMDDEWEKAGE